MASENVEDPGIFLLELLDREGVVLLNRRQSYFDVGDNLLEILAHRYIVAKFGAGQTSGPQSSEVGPA